MDHHEPSARTKSTDFPMSVEFIHLDGNSITKEFKSNEDQEGIIRKSTIPSHSEEYTNCQIDHRTGQNIDSKSLEIHRTSTSKRNEHNKSRRVGVLTFGSKWQLWI